MAENHSLATQIAEIELQIIEMRPARNAQKKYRLQTLKAILSTLYWLRDHRNLVLKIKAQRDEAQKRLKSPNTSEKLTKH